MTVELPKKDGRGGARLGSGRKPGPNAMTRAIQEMALEHAEEAFSTIVELSRNAAAESVRKDCSIVILERAYGRPKQGVELSGPDGGAIEISTHEAALALLK